MSSDPSFGGIIKLYDGLYIAQQFGARDIESILINHITHIINCSSSNVPNFFHQFQTSQSHQLDIRYLSYNFSEQMDGVIFDEGGKVIDEVYAWIERARGEGESTLIHGWKEYGLPVVLFVGYFMRRYRWGLGKSMAFVERRCGRLGLGEGVMGQLRRLEEKMIIKAAGELSMGWEMREGMDVDEQTIHNTYINALNLGRTKETTSSYQSKTSGKKKVSWKQHNPRPTTSKSKKPLPLKSILRVKTISPFAPSPIPPSTLKIKNQKNSASHSRVKQKDAVSIKPNSSLDNKSFKMIKDKIEDKLRTTIELFKSPSAGGAQGQGRKRLKSEPAQDEGNRADKQQQGKSLSFLKGSTQKLSKQLLSNQQIPVKRSLEIKERMNTDENENLPSDITRQIIKKIIFQKNNNFLFKNLPLGGKQNTLQEKRKLLNEISSNTLKPAPLSSLSSSKQPPKFKPIVNNFISNETQKHYSKPESPAQKSDNKNQFITVAGIQGKIDLKLKTQQQFRGFSPMLKESKKKEVEGIIASKIFEGSKKAWK